MNFTMTKSEFESYLSTPQRKVVRPWLNSAVEDYLAFRCSYLNYVMCPTPGAMAIEKYLKVFIHIHAGRSTDIFETVKNEFQRLGIQLNRRDSKGRKIDGHHLPSLLLVAQEHGVRRIPHFAVICDSYLDHYLYRYPDNLRIIAPSGEYEIKSAFSMLDSLIWELHWTLQHHLAPEVIFSCGTVGVIYNCITTTDDKTLWTPTVKWLLAENSSFQRHQRTIVSGCRRLREHWLTPDSSTIM